MPAPAAPHGPRVNVDWSTYSTAQLTDLARTPGPVGAAARQRLDSGQSAGVPDGATAEAAAQMMLGASLWTSLSADQQAAVTATASAQSAVAQIAAAEQNVQQVRATATAAIEAAQTAVAPVVASLPADQQAQVQSAVTAAQQAVTSLQAATDAGQQGTDHAQAAVDAATAVVAAVLPGEVS